MTKPILDPLFWGERFRKNQGCGELHKAVFETTFQKWEEIEEKHVQLLHDRYVVNQGVNVLDVGCGWGRLIGLLPWNKVHHYAGIDLCPEFINRAMELHPDKTFYLGEVRDVIRRIAPIIPRKFDLAVMVSFRPMVRRNLGEEVWLEMEGLIKSISHKRLYLEYDPNCDGFLEE